MSGLWCTRDAELGCDHNCCGTCPLHSGKPLLRYRSHTIIAGDGSFVRYVYTPWGMVQTHAERS